MKIAIIGLGYVGLPLAVRLAAHHSVTGIDVNERRVSALVGHQDATGEITSEELRWAFDHNGFKVSTSISDALGHEIYVITVPTPTDKDRNPDLRAVRAASIDVGRVVSPGSTVVFESTVAPGTTRDVVGALVAESSGLIPGVDFHLGYSPERINPGDKVNTVTSVTKVVAADDPAIAAMLAEMYGSINGNNIHVAPSIEVAEATKIFENTQRDVNIALMNEFSNYCEKVGISIWDVVDAMRTKWNSLPFVPGLVGGHCIGEDPYYLIQDGRRRGLPMRLLDESRSINNNAARDIAVAVSDACRLKRSEASEILLLGATFKENVPDVRNSLSFSVAKWLVSMGHKVTMHDPCATVDDMAREMHEWEIDCTFASTLPSSRFDAVVGLVGHSQYVSIDPTHLLEDQGVVFDARRIWSHDRVRIVTSDAPALSFADAG